MLRSYNSHPIQWATRHTRAQQLTSGHDTQRCHAAAARATKANTCITTPCRICCTLDCIEGVPRPKRETVKESGERAYHTERGRVHRPDAERISKRLLEGRAVRPLRHGRAAAAQRRYLWRHLRSRLWRSRGRQQPPVARHCLDRAVLRERPRSFITPRSARWAGGHGSALRGPHGAVGWRAALGRHLRRGRRMRRTRIWGFARSRRARIHTPRRAAADAALVQLLRPRQPRGPRARLRAFGTETGSMAWPRWRRGIGGTVAARRAGWRGDGRCLGAGARCGIVGERGGRVGRRGD